MKNEKTPIFIHSLFRTGSTYIWNKFRQNDKYYCYYEPFHPSLSEITNDNIEQLLTKDFESVNHPSLSKYYLYEYKKLLEDGRTSLPYFKKSFSFDEFCYNKKNPVLKRYIDSLIIGAGEKNPVLQFNRSSLRIKWFKENYPQSLNIYLIRNPKDQWQSYFEVLRKAHDNIFLAMDILTACVNAKETCFEMLGKQIPLIDYHDKNFNNEIMFYRLIELCYSLEEKYWIFYFTWLISFIQGVLNADFLLDINRLSEDSAYREKVEDLIFGHFEAAISFEDAKVRKYDHYNLDTSVMEDIEVNVQQLVFGTLDKHQSKEFVIKGINTYGHYLKANPSEVAVIKEINDSPFVFQNPAEKFSKIILLLQKEYLNQGERIHLLYTRLKESEEDRAARLNQINTLGKQLQDANTDRAARSEQIKALRKQLEDSNTNRTARSEQVKALRKQLQESNAECAARSEKIKNISQQLQQLEIDRETKLKQIEALKKRLQHAEEDQDFKQKVIQNLESRLTRLETTLKINNQEKEALESKLDQQKRELERIHLSLSWRLTRPLRWIKKNLKPISRKKNNDLKLKIKIAIDVTPVLPGGDNGGIKLLLWELLKRFNDNPKNDQFILLTSSKNDHLFNQFKMERICVLKTSPSSSSSQQNLLRTRIMNHIKRRFRFLGGKGLLKKNGISVLFCPFAAPTFSEIGIPLVSVIADLQHIYYPFFFSKQELRNRSHFYDQLRTKADYVIAISEYTRKTIIEKLNFSPEKVYAIPIPIHSRLQTPHPTSVQTILKKYVLYNKKYGIYPANLWPHKNHKMLITAFGMFQKRYPEYDLHLVLTGAEIENDKILKDSITQMGMNQRVHFTGYIPEDHLAVIWSQAYFLIFPGLFEGFGIPLVEAMRYKKPILASNATSIPEVAGDSALYFDPKKPDQMVDSIHRIMKDRSLYDELVKKGQEQLKKYNMDEMVDSYMDILHKASEKRKLVNMVEVSGIFPDGWAGETIQIFFSKNQHKKILDLRGFLPQWHPFDQMKVRLRRHMKFSRYRLNKTKELHIKERLSQKAGKLDIAVSKSFIPQSPDNRKLSFMIKELSIYDEHTGKRLYEFRKSK
jgi:glycosyltransferase involved in cell wall biosynthesis